MFPNPLVASLQLPVWKAVSMTSLNGVVRTIKRFSKVLRFSFCSYHLFSSILCSVSVIDDGGISKHSPTSVGSIHSLVEYRTNASLDKMYLEWPSFG